MKTDMMAVHQMHSVVGKKDILRDVVIKYIDHFYPDASGTSAVAIDNKIEQAMDLVKSHLMFAVREEVEVLKEKIAELMDRINQLEVENTILKANASQETLSQLSTAATIVSPQAQVQTSPAQPQSSPALSKISIDAALQVSNISSNTPIQPQPSSNPPQQNPTSTS